MKEAIGGVFLFNIVIFFILLFTGIMCLTINRSKAYQVKDEIITVIEEYEGLDLSKDFTLGSSSDAWDEISQITSEAAYRTTSTCPTGYTGFNRNGVKTSEESFICIKQTNVDFTSGLTAGSYLQSDVESACYFSVIVFYKLDIPVIGSYFTFQLMGETKTLYGGSCEA